MIRTFTILMFLTFSMSCGTHKEVDSGTTNIDVVTKPVEKQSLFNKLKENNHLRVQDRIALYQKLKKESPELYRFENDQELNQYGYSLLFEDKTKEAIEIFKLLVSEFPDNANAYDSLGEGYFNDGNEELALLNYEKSLKMNPDNNGAIDKVTILKGLELLVTDWGKEFFHFPIHFAPDVPYTGVEEVVFPEGWRKPESTDFWSYVFVWEIGNRKAITPIELEDNLTIYFDGLMDVVQDDSTFEMNKTSVSLQKNLNTEDDVDIFGKLTIFDAFATDKTLTLNARIFSNYCEEKKKLIVLFRFSPQSFDQPIWDKLRTVKVRESVCEE